MKYNKTFIFSVFAAATLLFAANACKKKTTTTDAPKTLNKSLLVGKKWYNQSGSVVHYFQSSGKYGTTTATWEWLNNSDSMLIDYHTGGLKEIWYFEWSTEHECSAKPSKNSTYMLFKDAKW